MVEQIPWRIECGDGPELLLAGEEADLVFADVPYSKAVDDGNEANVLRDNKFDFAPMTPRLMERLATAIATQCRRWALVMTSEEETHLWRAELTRAGMDVVRTGHWIRLNTEPQKTGDRPAQGSEAIVIAHSRIAAKRWNGGGKPAIWYAPIVRGDAKVHPTQKPPGLLKQLFEDFSDPGELIVDPTAGSFASGVVALSLGRRYYGIELQQHYVDLGRELMSVPLFDRRPLQASLFGSSTSSRAATARAELDRDILRLVNGDDGIGKGDLLVRLSASPSEISRALARLRKKQIIRREGKTSDSRYFRVSQNAGETEFSTGSPQP